MKRSRSKGSVRCLSSVVTQLNLRKAITAAERVERGRAVAVPRAQTALECGHGAEEGRSVETRTKQDRVKPR